MKWFPAEWFKPDPNPVDFLSKREMEQLEDLHGPDWGSATLLNTIHMLLAERAKPNA